MTEEKYRLAYIEKGRVRVLYDVHTGKPDHKHIDDRELFYTFSGIEVLIADFQNDIAKLT